MKWSWAEMSPSIFRASMPVWGINKLLVEDAKQYRHCQVCIITCYYISAWAFS